MKWLLKLFGIHKDKALPPCPQCSKLRMEINVLRRRIVTLEADNFELSCQLKAQHDLESVHIMTAGDLASRVTERHDAPFHEPDNPGDS